MAKRICNREFKIEAVKLVQEARSVGCPSIPDVDTHKNEFRK